MSKIEIEVSEDTANILSVGAAIAAVAFAVFLGCYMVNCGSSRPQQPAHPRVLPAEAPTASGAVTK